MPMPAKRLPAGPVAFVLAALLAASGVARAQEAADAAHGEAAGYRLPAPQAPRLSLSPRRDLIAYMRVPALPGIDVVAQPELKLAGLRIHPRTFSGSAFSFADDLWLQEVDGGRERRIEGLPSPLALASL